MDQDTLIKLILNDKKYDLVDKLTDETLEKQGIIILKQYIEEYGSYFDLEMFPQFFQKDPRILSFLLNNYDLKLLHHHQNNEFITKNIELIIAKMNQHQGALKIEDIPLPLRSSPRLIDAYIDNGYLYELKGVTNDYYVTSKEDDIAHQFSLGSTTGLNYLPLTLRSSKKIIDAILDNIEAPIYCLEGITIPEYLDSKKDKIIAKIKSQRACCSLKTFTDQLKYDEDLIEVIITSSSYEYLFKKEDLPKIEKVISKKVVTNPNIVRYFNEYFKDSTIAFEAIISSGLLDTLKNVNFNESVLSTESISYIVSLLEQGNKYLDLSQFPNFIKNSQEMVTQLIKRHDIKMLNGATKEVLIATRDILLEEINKGLFIDQTIELFPDEIKRDSQIINAMLNNNDSFVLRFASNEFLINHQSEIIKSINNGGSFSMSRNMSKEIRESKEIVLSLIKTGNIKALMEASDEAFDEEVINALIELIDRIKHEIFFSDLMGEFNSYPMAMRNSRELVTKILNTKRYVDTGRGSIKEDTLDYVLSGVDASFINENIDFIKSQIKEYSIGLINTINKYNISSEIKSSFWIDILNKNSFSPQIMGLIPSEILPYVQNIVLEKLLATPENYILNLDIIPDAIKRMPQFVEFAINKSALSLILSDPILSTLVTEDLVLKQITTYGKTIGGNLLPSHLKDSKKILLAQIESGYLKISAGFNQELFTADVLELIAKKIEENTFRKDEIDQYTFNKSDTPALVNSPRILESILKAGHYWYCTYFNKNAYTKENVSLFFSILKNEKPDIPFNALNSLIEPEILQSNEIMDLLIDCFKDGLFSITYILPDNILSTNINRFIANFPYELFVQSNYSFNNLSSKLTSSKEIIKGLIDHNYTKFYDVVDSSGLEANVDYIASKISDGSYVINNCYDLSYTFLKNPHVIKAVLDLNNLDLLRGSIIDGFDESNIDLLASKIGNGTLSDILYLPEQLRYHQKIIIACINTNNYHLLTGISIDKILENADIIAQQFNISKEEFISKINTLYSRNDEIFNTINLGLLDQKFSDLGIDFIERISLYGDIQSLLTNIAKDNQHLMIIKAMIKQIWLSNKEEDINGIIYQLLNNFNNPSYSELINNIDINSLSDESIRNLIMIFREKNNIYDIKTNEDLSNANFNQKKNDYFKQIDEKIQNNTIDLDTLKTSTLEKLFNLDLDMANFIIARYAFNLDGLEDIKNQEEAEVVGKIYEIIKAIKNIVEETDLEALKQTYQEMNIIVSIDSSSFSLESLIRTEFARLYSKSLYQPIEEHKTKSPMLQQVRYKGKDLTIYEADGDFKMQTHALGAYRDWERPENFANDWNRPKIGFHAICTSYISNDLIAPALIKNPVLGFSDYEPSALLLAGNYDLFSDNAIANYATSLSQAYTMLPPTLMKNYTRHNHNEMVLERRINGQNQSFKRLPNYVIYIVEDMNVKNFRDGNTLWEQTKQAAADFDVPIVIVNRQKYVKIEQERCQALEAEFFNTLNPKILRELMTNVINNTISCRYYDDTVSNGQETISINDVSKLYNKVLLTVQSLIDNNNLNEGLNIINELLYILNIESKCVNMSHKSNKLSSVLNYDIEEPKLRAIKTQLENLLGKEAIENERTI